MSTLPRTTIMEMADDAETNVRNITDRMLRLMQPQDVHRISADILDLAIELRLQAFRHGFLTNELTHKAPPRLKQHLGPR